jgi:vesicle coat complex subunit
MRSGKNVQSLFSSVLRCVKTSDIELKKLAYLYLINDSSHEPEQAIMAVNTFVQDSQDPNPLIRALAVRNMCRIRLESVAEHMVIPLKCCLKDPDPYVRKTVAFGIAKLYEIIPEVAENSQLFAISSGCCKTKIRWSSQTVPPRSSRSTTIGRLRSSPCTATRWVPSSRQ